MGMILCKMASLKRGLEFETAANETAVCTPTTPTKKRGLVMLSPPSIVRAVIVDDSSSVFRPTKTPRLVGACQRITFRSGSSLPRIPEFDNDGDDDDDDEIFGINFPHQLVYLPTHLHRRSTRLPESLELIHVSLP